jgi:AcrR family transcriptional regulator
MTLRERKKVRTREALAEAALELFARQGFEATTVEQIAAAAEVSRRTFFRYFPSKEAALFPDRRRRLEAFCNVQAQEPLSSRGSSNKEPLSSRGSNNKEPFEARLEAVRAALMELAADYTRLRERVIVQQRVVESCPALLAYDFELDRRWEDAITVSLAGPRPRAAERRRARLLAGGLMGLIRATLREWYAGGGRDDLAQLGQQAFALLRDGITKTTGEAR